MLDRGRVQIRRQLLVHALAGGAVVIENPHLDQPVGVQCSVDLPDHGRRQAITADQYHGGQAMGMGALFPALRRRQFDRGHGPYYRGRKKKR